jgi:hypothetical protein
MPTQLSLPLPHPAAPVPNLANAVTTTLANSMELNDTPTTVHPSNNDQLLPPPSPTQLSSHAIDLLYLPAKFGGIGVRSPYVATTASFILPVAHSICLAINSIIQPSTDNIQHLPARHQSILLKYKTSNNCLFCLFHQYGTNILCHQFPDDLTAHLLISTFTTSSLNLHSFQHDFHPKHYSQQQRSLYSNSQTATNAPSLTSP